MRLGFLLSGHHPDLPEHELMSVLESEGLSGEPVERRDNFLVFETENPDFDFSRLSLTREVSRMICSFGKDSFPERPVKNFSGSFAVRCVSLDDGDYDTKNIERRLGGFIEKSSGNSVDLSDPDTVFRAYLADGKIMLGERLWKGSLGRFDSRKNLERPFSDPVSLDPWLARSLVNLSGVSEGDSVLDPFCGTGTILTEAGLMGMEVLGSDLMVEMVEGCRRNLEFFDISGMIEVSEVSKVS